MHNTKLSVFIIIGLCILLLVTPSSVLGAKKKHDVSPSLNKKGSDTNNIVGNTLKSDSDTAIPINPSNDFNYRVALMSVKVLDSHSGTYPAHWYMDFGVQTNGAAAPQLGEDAYQLIDTQHLDPGIWNWAPGSEYTLYSPYNLTGSKYLDLNVPGNSGGISVFASGSAVDTGDIVLTQDPVLGAVNEFYSPSSNFGEGIHTVTSDKGDYQLKFQVIDLLKPTETLNSAR